MPRLAWIEIRGLRSFREAQRLDFEHDLALVWGGNSQGKTSVAEAFEFLLTGTTVRRELLGGSKNEYDNSLRNAFSDDSEPTFVRAGIRDDDGTLRVAKRELECDFERAQDCRSRLTIDGEPADDLSSLGVPLSEPPLRAPVLFQHSVRYALSSEPKARLAYFKQLLEVADLDIITEELKAVRDAQSVPANPLASELAACRVIPELQAVLAPLAEPNPSATHIQAALEKAVGAGLTKLGIVALVEDPRERLTMLVNELDNLDERRFSFARFRPGSVPDQPLPPISTLAQYNRVAARVNAEVERLRSIFEAVLAIPAYANATEPQDCPVCGTENGLTPTRLQEMRQQVAGTSELGGLQSRVLRELQTLRSVLTGLNESGLTLAPSAHSADEEEREQSQSVVRDLLNPAASLESAYAGAEELKAQGDALQWCVESALEEVAHCERAVRAAEQFESQELQRAVEAVSEQRRLAATARKGFIDQAQTTLVPLRQEVEKRSGLGGWRSLVKLYRQRGTFIQVRQEQYAVEATKQRLSTALADLEQAKLEVLTDKFGEMSLEIARWWLLLRPGEPVNFDRAAPKGKGLRFVDMKAVLSSGGQRVERDALGIFSDSQLNALGLAAFLARAHKQGAPVVFLDDPVQAGDDEHRATFVARVMPELLDSRMQIVVSTFDPHLRKLLPNQFDLSGFTVSLDSPHEGSVVVAGADTAKALVKDVKPYLDKPDVSMRDMGATKARTAAERVAKEILVAKRRQAGDPNANVLDYNGRMLGWLVPELKPHLDKRDFGNWNNFNDLLSAGPHDDGAPPKNSIKLVYDALMEAMKRYL